MQPNAILIDPHDNVVTVLHDILPGGDVVWGDDDQVTVCEAIPTGHKVAIAPVPTGEIVRKYGYPIGTATTAIAVGDKVHTHNLNAVEA
jgi:altronate hydrolase